jgi:hypothetical protein
MSSKFQRELRSRNKSHGYIKNTVDSVRNRGVRTICARPARPSLGIQGALIFLTTQQKRLTMQSIYSQIKSTAPSLD